MPWRISRDNGFTQVELVIVIVVVGVLAVAAAPRWADSGFDDRRWHDQAIATLRHAQKAAIALRRTTCVIFPNDQTMVVQRESAWAAGDCTTAATAVVSPDGTPLVATAARNGRFAATPATIMFNSLGQPGAGVVIPVANLPAALAITVEANTGYVH